MRVSELHTVSTRHNWEIRCMNGIIAALSIVVRKYSTHVSDDLEYLRMMREDMKENIKTERDTQLNKLRRGR